MVIIGMKGLKERYFLGITKVCAQHNNENIVESNPANISHVIVTGTAVNKYCEYTVDKSVKNKSIRTIILI